jgi:hypothetical protein
MSACSHKRKLSLLSFALLFVRSLISSATTQVPSTLIFSRSDPNILHTLSLPFHFSAFRPFFTAGNLFGRRHVRWHSYPSCLQTISGSWAWGIWIPRWDWLELESLCHSSIFSAVADSNLQLQKLWFVGSFGEFILGIQSYYQWALSCGCEFSPIFELSLYLKRNSWKKSLFLCWVSLSWGSCIVKCFGR